MSSHSSSTRQATEAEEKPADVENGPQHLEAIRTISKVPANPNYHEKGGLRTEGDGADHTQYNYRSCGFIMTVIGCAFGLCGSQIYPLLYLTLGTTIAADLGTPELYVWMLTAGILAMGSIAPFIGPLADLLGRKEIFLGGLLCAVVGSVVSAATPNSTGFIAGQVLLGFGAVISELLGIAIVAEIIPTNKRPIYAAIVLSAIIPWSPGTLYANWMATVSWRWIGLALGLWNLINFVIILVWYKPPPRVNSLGLSKKEQLVRIDFVGGFLSILGLVLFLIGLNRGGIDYPWKSGNVLGFLVGGAGVLIIFVIWEFFGAKYPLYPRRIVHAPRPFFCMIMVIFAAGINYIPLVVFWPIESISVFQADLFHVGIYALPIGICILGGAMICAILLAILPKYIHWLMLAFCIIQTVASACMTLIDANNVNTAWGPLVLALFGVGGVLVPNQVIITTITPDDLIASVTALTVGLRAQAQVIGISIFYNRLSSQVTKNTITYALQPFIDAGFWSPDLITEVVSSLTSTPFKYWQETDSNLISNATASAILGDALIETYIVSFRHIWYITIAFGVVACIASALMGNVSRFLDKHVAVVL